MSLGQKNNDKINIALYQKSNHIIQYPHFLRAGNLKSRIYFTKMRGDHRNSNFPILKYKSIMG